MPVVLIVGGGIAGAAAALALGKAAIDATIYEAPSSPSHYAMPPTARGHSSATSSCAATAYKPTSPPALA